MVDPFHLGEWRFALHNLILKDFRVRYRNMALGVLWSVLNPLVMLGVITFVFTVVYSARGRRFFPVFLLIGLVVFNLFSRTVGTATGAVLDNVSLIKKVAFPRMLIPFAVVCSQWIDGVILIVLLFAFVVMLGVPITASYLWLPVVFAVEAVFILGVSLLTSALNVYYRDVRYLVESGLTVLFWLTPILYPLSSISSSVHPLVYRVYLLNPLAGCIDAARRAVLEHRGPEVGAFGVAVAVSVATAAAGLAAFSVLQRRFADYT